jgi:hypothetical protein
VTQDFPEKQATIPEEPTTSESAIARLEQVVKDRER